MAKLFVPVAAGFVGYWLGGPVGASAAYSLASGLTAERQTIRGQQIGDLRQQTSSYGLAIPILIGNNRIAGNVIWATDKVPHEQKNKVGKGGGGGVETITITYTISCAILICEGPILGIKRVWSDGTLVVDGTVTDQKMPGLLYLGTHDQDPDPTIESFEGVGNVPAWRGYAYMVMTDLDLGPTGRLPMYSFEVIKEGGV